MCTDLEKRRRKGSQKKELEKRPRQQAARVLKIHPEKRPRKEALKRGPEKRPRQMA